MGLEWRFIIMVLVEDIFGSLLSGFQQVVWYFI